MRSDLRVDLEQQTLDLTRLLTELAEVRVGESEAWITGYYNSLETTDAARKREGDAVARDLHSERIRLEARVEIARIQRETTLALLATPDSPRHP